MNSARNSIAFTLAILLSIPATTFGRATPPINQLRKASPSAKPKLAPDLLEMLAQDDKDEALRLQGKTLAEVRRARLQRKTDASGQQSEARRIRANGVTLPSDEVAPEEKQSFIVQLSGSMPDVVWQEKLALLNGRVNQKLNTSGLAMIEVPRSAIRQLAAQGAVSYISPDRPVRASGHLTITTGADQVIVRCPLARTGRSGLM